ncbi:Protein kinase, catalytic domain-containing protein [Artemisia annua]|uniref:Protein kinase, catalytic domain-containing protein n=1 Tax=Artemisia annua TaxID=35608 RepID=A0A2U1QLP0_ARTAN|nr:Protein kinase, catalytic domain-containing protein [Artemisia annua]
MWEPRVYITLSVLAFIIFVALAASTTYLILKRILHQGSLPNKSVDLELRHLSLSVRTLSENKISFESSSHKLTVVETFTEDELTTATANFSSTNLIDENVYHGRHKGKNLAIKRTNHHTISKIKFDLFHDATYFHPNILKLLGTCKESDSAFLVFEYAKNGSLKDWIHGGLAMKSHFIASCQCFLTWNQRARICLDVATALQYMHQIMSPSYVHRNIKSRNIFLDEEFNAKIGNFGMEDCVKDGNDIPEEVNKVNTISWDNGYFAPELKSSGTISTSTDIYAFGVVLLEMLSGKPPVEEGGVLLCEKIKFLLESSDAGAKLREWMDNVLGEDYSFDAAIVLANLARSCVEDDPCLRPNAGEVVQKLSKLVVDLPGEEEEQFTVSESSSKPLVEQSLH